jgi:outer membrane protein OmpA-like peptidoglycan-associated protein
VKGKAELLPDANTRANVALLADKVRQYGAEGGRFVIEGHASAEGDGAVNQRLSEARADAIYKLLTQQHGVPPSCLLRAEGRGSRDAQAPATASEKELEQDRKVLAVKEQ